MGSAWVGRESCSPATAEGFSVGFCLAEGGQVKWNMMPT